MAPVPFLDLAAAQRAAAATVESALVRVARSGVALRGPETAAFETEWAAATGARGAVAVSSGTDALRLALLALGIGVGDEVIVPAHTSPYTALAVRATGATPRLADIDAATRTLAPAAAGRAIGPRTRALVAVHLEGRRADMAALAALADAHGLALIEDAAQAHGLPGPPVGRAAAYSFYPTKNLGALGDAGAVVSDDPALLARVRLLREGGQEAALDGAIATGVARIDELQAAVLRARLPFLAAWNARRRAVAARYLAAFDGLAPLTLPRPAEAHVWHLFVVEHPARDRFVARLAEVGIEARVHYGRALHQLPLFAAEARTAGPLAAATAAAARVASLPLHPGLDDATVGRIIDAVTRAAR